MQLTASINMQVAELKKTDVIFIYDSKQCLLLYEMWCLIDNANTNNSQQQPLAHEPALNPRKDDIPRQKGIQRNKKEYVNPCRQ